MNPDQRRDYVGWFFCFVSLGFYVVITICTVEGLWHRPWMRWVQYLFSLFVLSGLVWTLLRNRRRARIEMDREPQAENARSVRE